MEGYNMRTNIEISDETMKKALLVSGFKTKREVVEQALKEFIYSRSRKNLADIRGTIQFSDGYDYKTTRENG
jgi:Arc/MetJ family transcription regulator